MLGMNDKELEEYTKRKDKVKVLFEEDETSTVAMDDWKIETIRKCRNDKFSKLKSRKVNPDGTLKKTATMVAGINLNYYFDNRYFADEDKIYVVKDIRAIDDIKRGIIYTTKIKCYVLDRNKNNKLKVKEITYISDKEFIEKFTHTLNNNAMEEVLIAISQFGEDKITKDKMPI